MSETTQDKVNILKHFEEAVAACEVRLKDAEASQEIAERALKGLEKSLNASLKAANAEIQKTDNLIETLAGEDPSIVATLKKKSLDLRQKLESIVSDNEK
jgi:chromosome segregation ATPase